MTDPALSQLYEDSRARLLALVTALDERGLDAPVPACPGWRVRDVVAHLTAVAEDVLEGRLTGPPTEEQSAAQVARFPTDRSLRWWSAGTSWRPNLRQGSTVSRSGRPCSTWPPTSRTSGARLA